MFVDYLMYICTQSNCKVHIRINRSNQSGVKQAEKALLAQVNLLTEDERLALPGRKWMSH